MDDAAALRGRSLWLDQLPGDLVPRPLLEGATDVDVAIVGAGYTGLWTAYELLARDPHLRVIVIERDMVGFGASGRNGGWCIGELAGGHRRPAALDRAIIDTVDEVGRVVAAEAIECGFVKGGVVRVARTPAQLERQRAEIVEYRARGFSDDVIRPLEAGETTDRLQASGVLGGLHFAPCARVQPAALVRGLAEAVERRGGVIVEHTAATGIEIGAPGRRPRVETDRGDVRADVVVRAAEAYTRDLPGQRRTLVPLSSLMVATEPLGADLWERIGLGRMETFADDRRMVVYGQRTTDGRIAFGGRGAPYRFGSGIDEASVHSSPVHDRIAEALVAMIPALRGVRITHCWGGVLGVPRDWQPSVGLDRATGVGWAGGYVGEGVAAANLAGRTLADLIVGADSELVDLAWVGHRSRRWEPEPLRWVGINAALRLADWVDGREARGRRPRAASVLDRLVGG